MAVLMSASLLLFCQSAVLKSAIFVFLPCSVSPLPSAPWQEPHFAFQFRAVFLGSSCATAERADNVMVKTIAFANFRMGSFLLGPAQFNGPANAVRLIANANCTRCDSDVSAAAAFTWNVPPRKFCGP